MRIHGPALPRRLAVLTIAALALTGCASTIGGTATVVGAPVLSTGGAKPTLPVDSQAPLPPTGPAHSTPVLPLSSSGGSAPVSTPASTPPAAVTTPPAGNDIPDDQVGLKPGATTATLPSAVKDDQNTKSDQLAKDTIADLIDFYTQIFPDTFGQKFVPPAHFQSYDSSDKNSAVCGTSEYQNPNAAYFWPPCDTIAWDRGVLLPQLEQTIGELATPTVLAHEMGHRVQTQLKLANSNPTIVFEEQADCYAGAYWKWVADGNSKYFNFNQSEGMREALTSLMNLRDPVGGVKTDPQAHGTGFDRTFSFGEGYSGGPARCNKIDINEINARSQQFPFDQVPTNGANLQITNDLLGVVTDTVNSYFAQTTTGYKAPTLTPYSTGSPPACDGYTVSTPVDYCPATNTVSYDLAELQQIGTPTAGFESMNGDFSAVIMVVSRYALAAQAAGGSQITGNNAGLRALCYTGSWATWMKDPQGPKGLRLTPNDLDKAIYQVIASAIPASDANGATTAPIIDRVQALDFGVTQPITKCFEQYSG